MKEEQLNAFKDGVANALLDGDVDEDLKNKYYVSRLALSL